MNFNSFHNSPPPPQSWKTVITVLLVFGPIHTIKSGIKSWPLLTRLFHIRAHMSWISDLSSMTSCILIDRWNYYFFVTCLPFGSLLAPQASSKRVQGQMTPNNQTQHGPYCTFVQRHDSSNNWTLWGEKYCPRARLLATPQLQIAHSQSVYAPTVDNRHCHSIWGLYM